MIDDVEALRELNDSYLEAVKMGDVDRFREILADDFLCSVADGSLLDKSEFLELTAGPRTLRHLSADDVRIRFSVTSPSSTRRPLHDHGGVDVDADATPTSGPAAMDLARGRRARDDDGQSGPASSRLAVAATYDGSWPPDTTRGHDPRESGQAAAREAEWPINGGVDNIRHSRWRRSIATTSRR